MHKLSTRNQNGFSHIVIPLVIVVLAIIGFAGWNIHRKNSTPNSSKVSTNSTSASTVASPIEWNYRSGAWKPSSTPPACNTPLLGMSPVDMSKVTDMLYPGQTRGPYKAHGGFRFAPTTNDITVKMPMDGRITGATRYNQTSDSGVVELQYLVSFVNDCGISVTIDHLATLSPDLQAIMDTRPAPKLNDSTGQELQNGKLFKTGDILATSIGFKSDKNVFIDFGVYDYRQQNEASKNPTYAAAHSTYAAEDLYALCWFHDLPSADAAIATSLPAGSSPEGKLSDYCK